MCMTRVITCSAAILDRVLLPEQRCAAANYLQKKKKKEKIQREAHLSCLVHLRPRQTGGQEMFESTGNAAKTLSISRPHTIISNVTHRHTRTHWNIYNGLACLLMAPSVNYLPAEIQEQSHWNEEMIIGDLFFFFPPISRLFRSTRITLSSVVFHPQSSLAAAAHS